MLNQRQLTNDSLKEVVNGFVIKTQYSQMIEAGPVYYQNTSIVPRRQLSSNREAA